MNQTLMMKMMRHFIHHLPTIQHRNLKMCFQQSLHLSLQGHHQGTWTLPLPRKLHGQGHLINLHLHLEDGNHPQQKNHHRSQGQQGKLHNFQEKQSLQYKNHLGGHDQQMNFQQEWDHLTRTTRHFLPQYMMLQQQQRVI